MIVLLPHHLDQRAGKPPFLLSGSSHAAPEFITDLAGPLRTLPPLSPRPMVWRRYAVVGQDETYSACLFIIDGPLSLSLAAGDPFDFGRSLGLTRGRRFTACSPIVDKLYDADRESLAVYGEPRPPLPPPGG